MRLTPILNIYKRKEDFNMLNNVLLTAQEAANAGYNLGSFVIIALYIVVFGGLFYFMSRPQKKEQKRIAAMLSELEVGDTILTTSGFYGVVIDITDDTVIVEFGSNKNCRIPMQKSAIIQSEKPGTGVEAK